MLREAKEGKRAAPGGVKTRYIDDDFVADATNATVLMIAIRRCSQG